MIKLKSFEGTIDVTATGTVAVAPDEAVIDLTVITEAKTAAAAVSANAQRTQAVIDAVSKEPNHGVTTTGLGVGPIYSFNPDTGVSTIIGFRATNTVRVRTKPGYAGRVFDVGIQAGASQVSGISFGVQNEALYREEALRLAVKRAYAEARIVAETADVKIEGARNIQIDPGFRPLFLRSEALGADAPPTPVIPADVRIEATVRITYQTRVG
jgi:uncharacterized protein